MQDKNTIDTMVIPPMNEQQNALKAKVKSLSATEVDQAFKALFRSGAGGQEVDLTLAMECVILYRKEMNRRGILEPGQQYPPNPTMDRLTITHFVKFNGAGLKEWILEQYYGPAERDAIDFKLASGIYTEPFLQKYFPDNQAEITARLNRITTFIIPFVKDSSQMLDGGSAYDLGGLEP